jgi:hypothetical protein
MSARQGHAVTQDHDSSPAQLGWQAAEAIRTLNHRTHPPTLTDPAEAYELLAALATMAYRLPQLLGQLSRWLQAEHAAGRLRADTHTTDPATEATEVTAAAAHALLRASQAATCLAEAFDSAQQHLAQLAGQHP